MTSESRIGEFFAAAALGLAAAVAGVSAWLFLAQTDEPPAALAPAIELRDLDGQPQKLDQWRGKLVLVNFWATWCAPCVNEIPRLVEAQRRHGPRGLQVVGIAMDDVAAVRDFAARLQINYPLLAGQAEVVQAMDALGDELGAFPFSVLIAPDGRILDRTAGELSEQEIEDWLVPNLPLPASPP